MSKRGAASELTHDNWNDEDEPEEAGTFRKASNVDMASRKIRTAKRRGGDTASTIGGGTSIFKEMGCLATFGTKTDSSSAPSFSFFNKDNSNSSSNTTPSFSFGKTDTEPKKSTFGATENKSSTLPAFSFNSNNTNGISESTKPKNEEVSPKVNGFGSSSNKSEVKEKKTNSRFMSELKSLNETFLKWIKQHLDENVYVNLTPVLEDYKKYFNKLSEKNADDNASDKKEESNEKENKPVSTNVKKTEPASSGDSGTNKADEAPKPAFSFSSKSDDSKKSGFSFSSNKSDENKPSIFGNDSNSSSSVTFGGSGGPLTFGGTADSSSKPFSFGGFATAPVQTPATKEKTEQEENNEDEPPKVIVNEVKEDDAIYEKKCKLFYMKEKEYVERGLGTLFLKKAEEKTQLIIRANTNLGNILLNIIVGPSIGAMMRVGKNNVMIVCIPNPPIDPKSDNKTPVKMLLRVKTSEDADALLKVLEEHKG
ncbi:unnamed protein product [Meganyctiphanes norvegica]|uniref:RanBD1 domain-containing protein n=1 Tax=Meganyctiphanes norvegica TaxID=48144 RepID=A0AAV2QWM6_MEGNR